MAKWSRGVENGSQKWSQNHDKIDINFDPEKRSNVGRKNMKKWGRRTLKNLVLPWENNTFHEFNIFCNFFKKTSKMSSKMMPKSIQKALKKQCKIWMPKIAEDDVKRSGKGSKMEPEGVPKVDKIDVKNGVWKRSKNHEKIQWQPREACDVQTHY